MEMRIKKVGRYATYAVGMLVVFGCGFFIDKIVEHLPFREWDLTQPQAVIIAGAISGALLILAAYIAFHGQREQRNEENRRHKELLTEQSSQFNAQIAAQREEYREGHKASSDLKYRDEVRDVYVRTLKSISGMQDSTIRQYVALVAGNEAERKKQQEIMLLLLHERTALRGELRLVQTSDIETTFIALNLAEQSEASQQADRVRQISEGASRDSLSERDGKEVRVQEKKLAILMRQHLSDLQPRGEVLPLSRKTSGDMIVKSKVSADARSVDCLEGELGTKESSVSAGSAVVMSESRDSLKSSDTWEI